MKKMKNVPEDSDRMSYLISQCSEFMTPEELALFQRRMASPRSKSPKTRKKSEDVNDATDLNIGSTKQSNPPRSGAKAAAHTARPP